jgi:hypothetical protein
MALIKQLSTGTLYTLSPSYLIGRGRSCSLQLTSLRVSGAHASFYWRGLGVGWELRDLGSSNGTFVDDCRIETGIGVFVSRGARIAFGETADPFEMIDDTPPIAVAYEIDSSICIASEDNTLFLPDSDSAVLCVSYMQGEWVVDLGDGHRRVAQDGEVLSCGGRRFLLSLPQPWQATMSANEHTLMLSRSELRFTVSLDQDHISVAIVHDGRHIHLRSRAHADLLLFLARARLADQANPTLLEAEHGWVYIEDLCKRLKATESRIYVDTCRARQQLRDLGFEDADTLIENRRGARRIGVRRITIEP